MSHTYDSHHPHRRPNVAKRAVTVLVALAALAPTAIALSSTGASAAPGPVVFDENNCPVLPVNTSYSRTGVTPANYNADLDSYSMYNSVSATGAGAFYNNGYYGQGIDVALIDSGVADVPGLRSVDPENHNVYGGVVHGPDFSFDSQAPAESGMQHRDTAGHGTHMAGIINGADADPSALGANGQPNWMNRDLFFGVAPKARVVSVKVADAMGANDVTQVLQAITWVGEHKNDNGMNIRVLSLSYGTLANDADSVDVLSEAVEIAWRKYGLVVVVSAGNGGRSVTKNSQGVNAPAYNDDVIAVGAYDHKGTFGYVKDDTAAPWTSGASSSNKRNPDIAAPGASVPSLHARCGQMDWEIAEQLADGTLPVSPVMDSAKRFVRGSGTSQAAAFTAGAAALMLSKAQAEGYTFNNDVVKKVMRTTAVSLPSAPRQIQGEGELSLSGIFAKFRGLPNRADQGNPQVLGQNGTLDGARGDGALTKANAALKGDTDIFGNPVSVGWVTTYANMGTGLVRVADGWAWLTGYASLGGHSSTTGLGYLGNGTGPLVIGAGFAADPMFGGIKTWAVADWSKNRTTWGLVPTNTDFASESWTSVYTDDWEGTSWRGTSWRGTSWRGTSWRGTSWRDNSWLGTSWRGTSWRDNSWM